MSKKGLAVSMSDDEKLNLKYTNEENSDVSDIDIDFESFVEEDSREQEEQSGELVRELRFSDDSVKIYLQQIGKIPLLIFLATSSSCSKLKRGILPIC